MPLVNDLSTGIWFSVIVDRTCSQFLRASPEFRAGVRHGLVEHQIAQILVGKVFHPALECIPFHKRTNGDDGI